MLIVGLGNPGKEYEKTRHNVGFMFVDELAEKYNTTFKLDKKHQAMVAEFKINNEKHYLLKPMTYMNLSGIAVRSFTDYYKIPSSSIFIVVDDLDLDTGRIRIRKAGSSGGHNGLKSIFAHMNTESIYRMRVGINNNKKADTKDYVLGHFGVQDQETIEKTISLAKSITDDLIKNGIDYIMNKYNGVK